MIRWSEKPGNQGLWSTLKLNSQGFTEVTRIPRGHKDSQRSQGLKFLVLVVGSDWRRRVPQPDSGGGTLEAGTRHTGTAEEAGTQEPRKPGESDQGTRHTAHSD